MILSINGVQGIIVATMRLALKRFVINFASWFGGKMILVYMIHDGRFVL